MPSSTPRIHRFATKVYNATARRVPFAIKYGVIRWWRRRRLPYSLLRPSDTVVLIGSARDILTAGRARAVTASQLVGPQGMVVIVEADPLNCEALKGYAAQHGLTNFRIVQSGAWSERTTLHFLRNLEHPAANRLEQVEPNDLDVSGAELDRFSIQVDSVDNLLAAQSIAQPIRLVSITVNGAEEAILQGMPQTLRRCDAVSIARDWKKPDAAEVLVHVGFRKLDSDDRGGTYGRI